MVNITFLSVIVLLIAGIVVGYKVGFVSGISHLVALIVTLIAIAIISMVAVSFKSGETRNTIYSLILLVVLGTLYGFIKKVFKSAKAISNLPVIKFVDNVLGIATGIVWVILFIQGIFVLAHAGLLGFLSEYIMSNIANNALLTIMTLYNPLL